MVGGRRKLSLFDKHGTHEPIFVDGLADRNHGLRLGRLEVDYPPLVELLQQEWGRVRLLCCLCGGYIGSRTVTVAPAA